MINAISQHSLIDFKGPFSMRTTRLPETFKELKKSHRGPVYVAKFNASGEYCMTGSEDRCVCLYNPHKNMMIKEYKNLHNYDISGLAINEDNSKFATGGGDKNVLLTDVIEGKSIRRYSGHNARVNCLCFNEDCSVIVSGSYDTTVKFWDNRANSYHPIDVIKGFKDSVTHVQVRGTEIICGSMDGTVRSYELRTGQFVSDEMSEAVQSMAVSHSSRAYIISALNNTIYLIERSSGGKVKQYTGHSVKNYTINCCFNEEDSCIFSGSADGQFYVYDIMKTAAVKVIPVSESPLSALDVHSTGGLITAAHNGAVFHCKF